MQIKKQNIVKNVKKQNYSGKQVAKASKKKKFTTNCFKMEPEQRKKDTIVEKEIRYDY